MKPLRRAVLCCPRLGQIEESFLFNVDLPLEAVNQVSRCVCLCLKRCFVKCTSLLGPIRSPHSSLEGGALRAATDLAHH